MDWGAFLIEWTTGIGPFNRNSMVSGLRGPTGLRQVGRPLGERLSSVRLLDELIGSGFIVERRGTAVLVVRQVAAVAHHVPELTHLVVLLPHGRHRPVGTRCPHCAHCHMLPLTNIGDPQLGHGMVILLSLELRYNRSVGHRSWQTGQLGQSRGHDLPLMDTRHASRVSEDEVRELLDGVDVAASQSDVDSLGEEVNEAGRRQGREPCKLHSLRKAFHSGFSRCAELSQHSLFV